MGLWKDKKRKDWAYDFQYMGKRYGGRGYRTKAEARASREKRRKEVKSIKPIRQGMDFKTLASIYLDYAELKFVQKTYKYKAYVFRMFLRKIGNPSIDEITPHTIHNYLKTRPSKHNYNVHRKELSALFNFAVDQLEILNINPIKKLDKMPHTPRQKQPPTEQQVLKLIMAADPENELQLIQVLLNTLGRIGEVLRLTWQDVNFEKQTVTLWTRKRKDGSHEADEMPMNDDLYQVLWDLWKKRKQNRWVFFNEKTGTRYMNRPKLMRSLCKRAEIPYIGFHDLRHFMASFLADRKKQSTKTVQKLLRHKHHRTTEIYLHSIDNAAREAMRSVEGQFLVKTTTQNHYQNEKEKIRKDVNY
jgi:integrase